MANLRYVSKNYALNGTLRTPVPAADPSYPASNLFQPDRYLVTSYPDSAGIDATYYLDLGSGGSRTIDVVGLLGLTQGDALGLFPSYVYIRRGSVFPEDGTWSDVIMPINIAQNQRDPYYLLPSPLSDRYWKFQIGPTFNGFSLGNLLVGRLTDLGFNIAPGTGDSIVRQRTGNRTAMGQRSVSETGPPRYRLTMQFGALNPTQRAALEAMFLIAPVAMLHPTRGLMVADADQDEVDGTVVFTDNFGASVSIEQLP